MVRGSGKFKAKRGGGRSFTTEAASFGRAQNRSKKEESEEESSEEESEEEESGSEEESEEETVELTREQKRALKKKQAEERAKKAAGPSGEAGSDDDDADLVNTNRITKQMKLSDLNAPRELSRREREQKEKADAKERYWKLHLAGKTDEAKSDLARLAKIRADREAAAAKRKAEEEARKTEAEQKRQAQLAKRK